MVEKFLRDLLMSFPNVANTATDVTPHFRDEDGQLPAITYEQTSLLLDECLDGELSGFATCGVDIDVWSSGYKQGKELAENIALALVAYEGTISSVNIYSALLTGFSESAETEPSTYYGVHLKFIFYIEV